MPLAAGSKLGPYEIVAPLGAGGMGEVYRARDTRLGREVAIKVLPERLAASAEVRQRFEREAKTISQLSHPHICALYDVGRDGETEYLVMELLSGDTLTDRLAKGPLPVEQTLRYGIEIADALEKAHRQGIVHRDLKPGNIMLTKSGVKLLDFGLAKAMSPPESAGSLTALPTQQGLTQEGTILGTFQYMAPEQLEGKEADARTDIFALGAVLHEMATGRKAFSGTSQASLISSIMSSEPPAISTVQPMAPRTLDRVVRICLAKDAEDRWQSAGDLARELRWIAANSSEANVAALPISARRSWLPWTIAAAAILTAAALAVATHRAPATAAKRMELSLALPERTMLTDFFAISPDGKTLAYAGTAGGKLLLRLRDLGSSDVRALPGTESPESVFWSPDSRSLAFVSRGKLRRIDLASGSIEALADAESGRGGTWGEGGDIVFARQAAGTLYRVAASGGAVSPATQLEKGDLLHRWPQFLPDGKRFLYFVKTGNAETTGIYLSTVGKPGRKLVQRNGASGLFVPPHTLLYGRNLALLAQDFEPATGELSGAPETVTRPVTRSELGSYLDSMTVSRDGVLVYRAGSADRQLTWVDRRGKMLQTIGKPGVIMSVALSPDEREAAISVREVESSIYRSELIDLARDASTPIREYAAMPVWTPDGRTLIYRFEAENYEIHKRTVHGDANDASAGVVASFATPHSVSPDGRFVLFSQMGNNFDIGVKDLQSGDSPTMVVHTAFDERSPHFSPDGRWFTYSSDEPGQTEIFVRRFPATEETWRISTSGGQQPTWSHDGKEIIFVSLDGHLMAAPVSTAGGNLTTGAPQALFPAPLKLNHVANQYAVSADGQRFLLALPVQDLYGESFRVLLNWNPR